MAGDLGVQSQALAAWLALQTLHPTLFSPPTPKLTEVQTIFLTKAVDKNRLVPTSITIPFQASIDPLLEQRALR